MFSCDEALAEISAEYKGMPMKTRAGKTVTLRNLLLLGTEGLKTTRAVLSSLGDDDADGLTQLSRMRDLLLLIADDCTALEKEIADWPLGMYVRVLDEWREVTEVGEVPDSES